MYLQPNRLPLYLGCRWLVSEEVSVAVCLAAVLCCRAGWRGGGGGGGGRCGKNILRRGVLLTYIAKCCVWSVFV